MIEETDNSPPILLFNLVIGRPAIDDVLQLWGFIPTEELRDTISLSLKEDAERWVRDTVLNKLSSIATSN